MKSLIALWYQVAAEAATRCGTSITLDLDKVQDRVKNEGLSFLTITLASFGKDFQKSLDLGYVAHDHFLGFAKSGGLPRFLGGFLERIFDRDDSCLLDDPCIDSIHAVRQLTLMFSKIELPCSPEREKKAFAEYVKCENEMKKSTLPPLGAFERLSTMLYSKIFTRVDRRVYYGDFFPKHGPGMTADGLLGNKKYAVSQWPERLERYFPFGEMCQVNWRYPRLSSVHFVDPGSETPVKVVSVPKTLKTPRIIAMEPTAMQYAQQGILSLLIPEIESDIFIGPLLGFTDQEPNQLLACKGSLGELATLDLSEASDRVSNQLVRSMMRNHPHLSGAVDSCRSRKADVPGHGVIRLSKFASMGSALCFPIEAMTFLLVCLIGIEKASGRNLTMEDIKSLHGRMRIYGDDIIIPVEYVHIVVEELENFGFRVNLSKSYWNGKFRESCGKEYYNGSDVSIVKVRQPFPARRRDVKEVLSLVSTRNQFYWSGWWRVTRWLDKKCTSLLVHFPTIHPTSPLLGRETLLGLELSGPRGPYQAPLVKGFVTNSPLPRNECSEDLALLKCLLVGARRSNPTGLLPLPTEEEKHLTHSGRPAAVYLKLRYASPF